jgi:hypothetical protein
MALAGRQLCEIYGIDWSAVLNSRQHCRRQLCEIYGNDRPSELTDLQHLARKIFPVYATLPGKSHSAVEEDKTRAKQCAENYRNTLPRARQP